jgi:hypothetical protein
MDPDDELGTVDRLSEFFGGMVELLPREDFLGQHRTEHVAARLLEQIEKL